jgi:hypothetical protein
MFSDKASNSKTVLISKNESKSKLGYASPILKRKVEVSNEKSKVQTTKQPSRAMFSTGPN